MIKTSNALLSSSSFPFLSIVEAMYLTVWFKAFPNLSPPSLFISIKIEGTI
jgi:hypothetical protein